MDLLDFSKLPKDELRAVLLGNSFKEFVKWSWPLVSHDSYKHGYLQDALCEHLQALHKGQIKRLVVATAIRHGKSMFCSVLWPTWIWLSNPSLRILSASCIEDLAERDARRARTIINSTPYKKLFDPIFTLTLDQNQKDFYVNTKGGSRKSVGTHTSTTGLDADVIIVDDLIDLKKARSEVERRSAIDYYLTVLSKRLVLGTGNDRILIAGHRVHEEDLFAEIRNIYGDDGDFTYLVLPAEAKPSYTNSLYNGLGWKDTRAEGEILSPERFDAKQLAHEKKSLRHEYHTQFNQDPSPPDGDQFKSEWFRYYTVEDDSYVLHTRAYSSDTGNWETSQKRYDKAANTLMRFCTVDTAISERAGADWTVCQVWDIVGQNLVLVYQLRKRLSGVHLIPQLKAVFQTYNCGFMSIESQFVGQFVIDQLKAENVVVKGFNAQRFGLSKGGDRSAKSIRAVSAEIRMEAGRVYFPKNVDWVATLEKEILGFPNGAFDDQIDALSMSCLIADKYLGECEPDLTPEELQIKQQKEVTNQFREMLWAGSSFDEVRSRR